MRRRSRPSYEDEHRYSAPGRWSITCSCSESEDCSCMGDDDKNYNVAFLQNMPSAAIETDDEVEEVYEEELSDVVSTSSTIHRNCPLDKDELGRSTWGLLHTIAAYYPENPSQETKDDVRIFFEKFSKMYPCKSCADHFREQITTYPPKVSNQQTLSRWLCDMHNLVNQRTGKPIFDCSRVNERWRDGWKDGSCD